MYPDFLTCGRCSGEFPLSKIDDFIFHKMSCLQPLVGHNYDPWGAGTVLAQPVLSCFICQQDFRTARGILQHVQFAHHMDIVLQKMSPSVDQPLLSCDKQVNLSSNCAESVNPQTTQNDAGCAIPTATTFTDNQSTTVSSINSVSVSPSKKVPLPVMCAKIASSEGTTICCNGKECQVTVKPPKTVPPKKCCSSIVPKKRNRHMQEHSSEDMEQSALETLTTFRGRFLLNQKSKSCQRKSTNNMSTCVRHSRKSKAKCVMKCDKKIVCIKKKNGVCEQEKKKECSEVSEEEESDKECVHDDSDCEAESGSKKHKIKIYSIEKDQVTSRETVIMNSGMTVTLEPAKTATSDNNHDSQEPLTSQTPTSVSQNPNQTLPNLDASSRESAQILAELMFHTAASHFDHSLPVPTVQTLPAQSADSHAPLIPLASSLSEPVGVHFSSASAVSFSNSLNTVDVSSSMANPLDMNANIPVSKIPEQFTVSPPMDIQPLSDLEAFTPSFRLLDSLDQESINASSPLTIPDISLSLSSGSLAADDTHAGEREGKKSAIGKKRRYPTSRPYKCSECDHAFNQPIHLKKHMSKHTGVKPFKCEECDYSTVERSHLRAHNRIHTGEKPFQCQFCNYATAQNSTLRVHLKRHHQDKRSGTSITTPPSKKQGGQQNQQ